MEGLIREAGGDAASAYEYYKKAYNIDPSYTEAGSYYGTSRLQVDMDSLQTKKELLGSLSLMRPFVDKYPSESFESQFYGIVAAKLDTVSEAVRVFERTSEVSPEKTSSLIHLADLYNHRGELDKALDALNRYEKAEGMNPQVTLKKAQYHLSRQDTIGALREITLLQEANPTQAAFMILKGNFFDLMNLPDSTFYYFCKAEKADPEYGNAKLALANYYLNHGDSVNYDKKIYEALLAADFGLQEKTEILATYLQALLTDNSNKERGDYLFSVLREQYPHEPSLLDLAARYSAAKGDFADAQEQISYALDLDPTNENYWRQLMSYQMSGDRKRDALATYKKAQTHITPSFDLTLLYGTAAQLDGDHDQAVEIFGDMIHDIAPALPVNDTVRENMLRDLSYEDFQKLSTLYTIVGDNRYQQKKVADAMLAYSNALVFLPNNASALNNYAYFLAEEGGELAKAEEMSRETIVQEPENETYLDTFAWIMFKKGDYKEARKYQEKAIEIYEREEGHASAEMFEHFGDILFMDKEPVKALEYWKKALEIDPDNEILKKKVAHKTYFYE